LSTFKWYEIWELDNEMNQYRPNNVINTREKLLNLFPDSIYTRLPPALRRYKIITRIFTKIYIAERVNNSIDKFHCIVSGIKCNASANNQIKAYIGRTISPKYRMPELHPRRTIIMMPMINNKLVKQMGSISILKSPPFARH
jgi:hypothetical protein